MNIRIVGFAVIVVSVASGCASTIDMDEQNTVQGIDTVQGTETVQRTASVQSTDTVQDSDDDTYDRNKIICKRIAKTGSRVPEKVCATAATWQFTEDAGKDTVEKIQRQPHTIDGG